MYHNPYSHCDFFSFFVIFFQRVVAFFLGKNLTIASDEIQLLTLSFIALASAIIGVFLVLRKMTMLANALSHTTLIGMACVYLFFSYFQGKESNLEVFIIASLITGLITAFCTEFLTKVIKLQEDAGIGLVFTTLFALGIIMVTLFAKDSHIGVEVIMGNVDALQKNDITLAIFVFSLNFLFVLFFFKELKMVSFDPFLSSTFGISPTLFKLMLSLLTAATTMCAFRAVGVLMVLAFLTGPILIAQLFTYSLTRLLLLASFIGIAVTFIGVAFSRHILTVFGVGLSTGGIVVCILTLLYVISLCYKKVFVTRKAVN